MPADVVFMRSAVMAPLQRRRPNSPKLASPPVHNGGCRIGYPRLNELLPNTVTSLSEKTDRVEDEPFPSAQLPRGTATARRAQDDCLVTFDPVVGGR